jgi:hypothetical protein
VPVRKAELKGDVSGLTGGCPGITFQLNGRTVFGNSSTDYKKACADVRNGRRVEVKGDEMSDGKIRAAKIEVLKQEQDDDDDDDD